MNLVTRRHFLHQAIATSALAALGVETLFGESRIPVPSAAAWRDLQSRLRGKIVLPGTRRYLQRFRPFNRRYANIRPAGIALAATSRDVQECILWARDLGLPLVARAGGHSYGGYSTTRGLLVDFAEMREVDLRISEGSVVAAAGVRNKDIRDAFRTHRVAIPAGRCPTVAISGLTLGGGFGFSSRMLGLTSDRLLSTEVVTANGEILHCSEKENSDLFWACRGGGGGNFGINTKFHFRLSPINRVAVYKLSWNWKDARDVLMVLQEVMKDPPPEFSLRLGIGSVGETPEKIRTGASISALGQFFGSEEEMTDVLAPLMNVGPATHIEVRTLDYWDAQRFFYRTAPINRFASKSHYIRRPLSMDAVDILVNAVERRPPSSNPLGGGATFFGWGGNINRLRPDATAFVHRDSIMLMDLDTAWTREDAPPVARANLRWLQRLSEDILPHVSGMAYQNFIDPTLETWRHSYYGENFDRLVRIKRRYDPENYFRFRQSIPTR